MIWFWNWKNIKFIWIPYFFLNVYYRIVLKKNVITPLLKFLSIYKYKFLICIFKHFILWKIYTIFQIKQNVLALLSFWALWNCHQSLNNDKNGFSYIWLLLENASVIPLKTKKTIRTMMLTTTMKTTCNSIIF